MKRIIVVSAISLSALVSGCGGGGSEALPSETEGTIQGQAFSGAFEDAQVTIYEWNGARGDVLKEGSVLDEGEFSLSLGDTPSQTLLVEVRGAFQDFATTEIVFMEGEERLSALLNYQAGSANQIAVTPFTTIALGLSEHKVSVGAAPDIAIIEALEAISGWVGFSVGHPEVFDLASGVPVSNGLENAHKAGMVTAAWSQMASWAYGEQAGKSLWDLTEAAVSDIRFDGLLDGRAESGPVSFGGYPASEATYRRGLATNVLVAAERDQNLSGLVAGDVFGLASSINQSQSPVFTGATVEPLSSQSPTITNVTLRDGSPVSGSVKFAASVVDVEGVADVSLYVNGVLDQFAGNSEFPEFQIETSAYPNGTLPIQIRARNFQGQTSVWDAAIEVSNELPVITWETPSNNAWVSGVVTFSAVATAPGGIQSARFLVDGGIPYYPESLASLRVAIDTDQLTGTEHSITLKVLSQTGVEADESINFRVDKIDPVLSWNLESRTFLTGEFNVTGQATDNVGVKAVRLYVDGTLINTYDSGDFQHSIDTTAFPDGDYVVAVEIEDVAGNVKAVSRSLLFDNTPPTLELTNPLDGDVLTSDTLMSALYEDTGGIDGAFTWLVDGVQYSQSGSDGNGRVTRELNVSNYSRGPHTVGISVTDRAGHTTTETVNVVFDY